MLRKNKLLLICISFVLLAIILRVVFFLLGSELLEDGTLVEPFYLVGLSIMSMFIAILFAIYAMVKYFVAKYIKSKK